MDANKERPASADHLQGLPPAPWLKFLSRPGGVIHLRPDLDWHDTTLARLRDRPSIPARPMVVD